jgi:iron complex outermembrane receptor protein
MKLNTFNYNAKYYLPSWNKIETIIGIQGMRQTNTNSGEEYLIPDALTRDFGVFGTANYEWKSNVIQAGLRFDTRSINTQAQAAFVAIEKNYTSWNASLGYKTSFTDHFIFRLNVASGFRAPNLAELTSNGIHEGANRYEVGNANLKTEQNLQTDLNLEYQTDHVEFFVNGFYNHIANYIYLSPTGNQFTNSGVVNFIQVYDYIQNNANLYGGEIGLHFHPHPLDWLHFETSFETVTGKKENSDYLPLIPANNWNNTLRFELNDINWMKESFATISLSSTFNQNQVSGFETRTGGYSILNLGLGGALHFGKTKVEVNLNVNNSTDKKYIAHLSRLKTDGISNIGRNIILGLNFNL